MNIFELTRILNESQTDLLSKTKNQIHRNVETIKDPALSDKMQTIEKITRFYSLSDSSRPKVIYNRLLATNFFNGDDVDWAEKFITKIPPEERNSLSKRSLSGLRNVKLTSVIQLLRDKTFTKPGQPSIGRYELLFAFLVGGTKSDKSGDVIKDGKTYEIKCKDGTVGYLNADVLQSFGIKSIEEINNNKILEEKIIKYSIKNYIYDSTGKPKVNSLLYFYDNGNLLSYEAFTFGKNGFRKFLNSCYFKIESHIGNQYRVKIKGLK